MKKNTIETYWNTFKTIAAHWKIRMWHENFARASNKTNDINNTINTTQYNDMLTRSCHSSGSGTFTSMRYKI